MRILPCAGTAAVKRRAAMKFLQALAFAVALILALHLRASEDRAVKSRVDPIYPEIAKRMHISGDVKLEVIVDAQGKVKDVKPVSGNHMLSLAAEDAVRQWKYVPGDGDDTVSVTIIFTLGQ
jgi:TonB family protein